MLANVEKVIKGSKAGRDRLKFTEERLAARGKMMREAAAKNA